MSSYFVHFIFGLSQKIIYSDLLDLLRAQGHLLLFTYLFRILINAPILLDFLFSSFLVLFSLFSVLFFSSLSCPLFFSPDLCFFFLYFLFILFPYREIVCVQLSKIRKKVRTIQRRELQTSCCEISQSIITFRYYYTHVRSYRPSLIPIFTILIGTL